MSGDFDPDMQHQISMKSTNEAAGLHQQAADPGLTKVSAKEFAAKFKSKRECYNFLAGECDVYLPPYGTFNFR